MNTEKPLEVVPKSFLAPAPQESAMAIATTRAAQETQAAMIIAKKFPRNETLAFDRIMQACSRKSLAEVAQYAFPRGGQTVSGPSIRLAEVLARAWGNIDCGIIELEQSAGESTMMAFAWDLETNARSTKIFNVKHIRSTKHGNKELDDPRDIYEMTANQGARRLRSCILSVIPGDFVEAALDQCDKTLANQNKEPLTDRIRAMVSAFSSNFQVTLEMLEKRLGHKIDVTTEQELVTLKKIYVSLRDNMAKRDQFFDLPTAVQSAEVKKPEATAAASVAAPAEEPAKPNEDPDIDRSKPIDSLLKLAKRDQVAESSVLAWAKKHKLAGAACPDVAGMSETKVLQVLDAWPNVVEEIKKL